MTSTGAVPSAADVSAALDAQIGFWSAITTRVVAGVTIDPVDSAVIIDEATGLTTAEVTASAVPSGTTGSDTSPDYVSGTGGAIDWRTGFRRRSRELRGRTFIIPMGSGQFTPSGNLDTACITNCVTAANDYVAAMTTAGLIAAIYGRPMPARGVFPAEAGLAAPITVGDMSVVPAFLRRRRS